MSKEELIKISKMTNIAEEGDLSDSEILEIGNKVLCGFKEDLNSQSEWLEDVKKVEELASLSAKKKNLPLPNSANIKYPLISKAAFEFASRTYPEIVKDGALVKARVLGQDFSGLKALEASRVSDFMNYQLLYENSDWEQELEKLLNQLPLIGFICKKTYYDPVRKAIKSVIVPYKDLIISSEAKNLRDAARVSHIQHVKLNYLIECSRSGVFCEEVVDEYIKRLEGDEKNPEIDIVEQETTLDLDGDNLQEPYFVTFIKETGEILRIAPRFLEEDIHDKDKKILYIDPIEVYTDYHFLSNPKGKFQGVGFGALMLHLNETINSLMNQLVDAGQLANMQGGLIDSKLKGIEGQQRLDPGQWTKVKTMGGLSLKDGVFPVTYKEPSSVLQQLLGMLIESGKDLSSSSEVMTGSTQADNAKTGAVMALQQQGLKIFTSIYKGIYRSLGSELKKIYRLNAIYLDPEKYYNILDDEKAVFQKDFENKNIDIVPLADPNLSSQAQKQQKIQEYMALMQLPGMDPAKISKKIAGLITSEPLEELMADPNTQQPPNPEQIKIQAEIQNMAEQAKLKGHELSIKEKEVMAQIYKTQCECIKLKADAMLAMAKAESEKAALGFQEMQMQLDILSKHMDAAMQNNQMGQDQEHHQDEMRMRQQELDQYQQEIENARQSEAMAESSDDSSGTESA